MVLTWAHSWSASDDGSILSGVDLGNTQSDIDSQVITLTGVETISGQKTFSTYPKGMHKIQNDNEDTSVDTEASLDEDKIIFKTAGSERVIIDKYGNVGIGTTDPGSYKLYVNGALAYCSATDACDIAERMHSLASKKAVICNITNISKENKNENCYLSNNFKLEFENGDVVCAVSLNGKEILIGKCNKAYDKRVLGVISYSASGVLGPRYKPYPVSIGGNVAVKVICDEPIEVGDSLVYSGIENYAMKLSIEESDTLKDFEEKQKGVFAKALESCSSGKAIIRAWV